MTEDNMPLSERYRKPAASLCVSVWSNDDVSDLVTRPRNMSCRDVKYLVNLSRQDNVVTLSTARA